MSPLPPSWAQGQHPFPSPQCPGALETRLQDTSCPAPSPACLTPADPCVSLRTTRHPCPPPDPWALTDPALRPGSGSPGSAAPLLRTLDTATTAFTLGPDLCPGLQACHPWEASGAISASARPKLHASPLSRPHLRPWWHPLPAAGRNPGLVTQALSVLRTSRGWCPCSEAGLPSRVLVTVPGLTPPAGSQAGLLAAQGGPGGLQGGRPGRAVLV